MWVNIVVLTLAPVSKAVQDVWLYCMWSVHLCGLFTQKPAKLAAASFEGRPSETWRADDATVVRPCVHFPLYAEREKRDVHRDLFTRPVSGLKGEGVQEQIHPLHKKKEERVAAECTFLFALALSPRRAALSVKMSGHPSHPVTSSRPHCSHATGSTELKVHTELWHLHNMAGANRNKNCTVAMEKTKKCCLFCGKT